MLLENGVNDLSLEELEELFKDDVQPTPPSENDTTPPEATPTNDVDNTNTNKDDASKDATKSFAKRLAEEKAKFVKEEREIIAKSLGFNSFEELQKNRERKLYEDKGFNPEEVSPLINELVEQKINSDPRMKELEQLRAKQIEEFGKKELAEITKLTNGEITKLSQLPKEVIDLWKQKGSLKKAYIELEGEKLIIKNLSEQSKGSTGHLTNLSGNSNNDTKRHLTDDEKKLWKYFNPSMTDEDLNNKLVDKT